MHPYSTDTGDRFRVLSALVIPSVVLSLLVAWVTSEISFPYRWLLESPSILGIYAVLYKAFDRWFWKWPFWRRIELVRVPDLSGEWSGHTASHFNDELTELAGVLIIRQTLTQISIQYRGPSSGSHSEMAAVMIDAPGAPLLTYGYVNEPRSNAAQTLHIHRGTARLEWQTKGQQTMLDGSYYTGRGRLTHGEMRFTRESA